MTHDDDDTMSTKNGLDEVERGKTSSGLLEQDAKGDPSRDVLAARIERDLRDRFPEHPEQVEVGLRNVHRSLNERQITGRGLPDVKVVERRLPEHAKEDLDVDDRDKQVMNLEDRQASVRQHEQGRDRGDSR